MNLLKLVLLSLSLPACITIEAPVDRITVMESEAAGEWPQLDKRFSGRSLSIGPKRLPKVSENKRKERIYNILNSDLTSK